MRGLRVGVRSSEKSGLYGTPPAVKPAAPIGETTHTKERSDSGASVTWRRYLASTQQFWAGNCLAVYKIVLLGETV